jgi:tryptophan-rich sensory protein
MNSRNWFVALALILLVIYMVGSGIWVSTNDSWYRSLNAPSWQPPDWVFGTIWPYNFLMIAVSIFTVSKSTSHSRVIFLISFAVTVIAALTWAHQFYVAHNLYIAAVSLLIVPLLTLVMTVLTFRASIVVGVLLIPYQVWVALATGLSFTYAAKN